MKFIDAKQARHILHRQDEVGFIDIREPGQFIEGHALFAVPLSYSRLEIGAPGLLPRRDVQIILIDDGDGVCERAAHNLENLNYTNINVVTGGMPAWRNEGFPVYKGINVPSKTLGEMAEEVWHPEMMKPDELASQMASDNAPVFLDCRPPAEYMKMSIPGALCVPNGELAHRIEAMPNHLYGRPVVLTCAGRTRGIIGSIGLKLSGYDGPVYALENGTQGWALSGRALERGNIAAPLPEPDASARKNSRHAANRIINRFGLSEVTKGEALAMASDRTRSTYVFDLRTEDEATQNPLGAAMIIPGVQLVQATDQYVGVRRARMIICCDTGLRSAIAAFWLTQLGFEPHILILDDYATLPAFPILQGEKFRWVPPFISSSGIKELPKDTLLLDVCGSKEYRATHLKGAKWAIRPRLKSILNADPNQTVIFIDEGGDDVRASLCAKDALDLGYHNVFVLEGGYTGIEGLEIETSPGNPPDCDRIDFAFFVHDRHDGNLEASRQYLQWETGLINQLDAAERAEFHLLYP